MGTRQATAQFYFLQCWGSVLPPTPAHFLFLAVSAAHPRMKDISFVFHFPSPFICGPHVAASRPGRTALVCAIPTTWMPHILITESQLCSFILFECAIELVFELLTFREGASISFHGPKRGNNKELLQFWKGACESITLRKSRFLIKYKKSSCPLPGNHRRVQKDLTN